MKENYLAGSLISCRKHKTLQADLKRTGGRKAGAHETFGDIIALYSERVYNLAIRILGNKEDAEEATQDVFMRILNSLDDFRGDSSLATWIWRITANVCLSRRKKKTIDTVSLNKIEFDPPDGRTEQYSRQERSFFARERADIINRYISSLPPGESAVITLFYLEELSYEEISEVLKMPMGTVSTALHRGRQRLGELLRGKKGEL